MEINVLIILHTLTKKFVSTENNNNIILYNCIILYYRYYIPYYRYNNYTYYLQLYKTILLYSIYIELKLYFLFIRRFVTVKPICFVAFGFNNGTD